ncbi:MAG TPA: class I SAM-dependent methyltransferase [Burkholderiales bacterium]|nr:class I SAM-dependent methyltransferase [Burkholderiales bacterium]
MSDAGKYAGWYGTPRGRWIGETEGSLMERLVGLRPEDSLLDVGCGTGYFTGFFAQHTGGTVIGLDPNTEWLRYGANEGAADIAWVAARAEALPFADRTFDVVTSVTALCFIADQAEAVREMLRVCRRRIVLGLLNRHSLLWFSKGRHGGTGSYQGAYWHTIDEARTLLQQLGCSRIETRTAVFFPDGGPAARWLEAHLPNRLLWGAFLAVVADVDQTRARDPQFAAARTEPVDAVLTDGL